MNKKQIQNKLNKIKNNEKFNTLKSVKLGYNKPSSSEFLFKSDSLYNYNDNIKLNIDLKSINKFKPLNIKKQITLNDINNLSDEVIKLLELGSVDDLKTNHMTHMVIKHFNMVSNNLNKGLNNDKVIKNYNITINKLNDSYTIFKTLKQ